MGRVLDAQAQRPVAGRVRLRQRDLEAVVVGAHSATQDQVLAHRRTGA
jgi:hypothetical protein